MSPHRLTVTRRYKVSSDILILILETLDLSSLLSMSKAFKRVYALVMEFQPLRYRFELALTGMKDGPVLYQEMSPLLRLQLLLAYKKDWPRLYWTHELPTPTSTNLGVSGGFLFNIRSEGNHSELRISELPSCRTGRVPELTRHLKFITTRIEGVVIDPSQSFIATSHVSNGQNGPAIQLKLRDMWTFDKHPKALQHAYEFGVPISQEYSRISGITMIVCGSKLAVSVEFVAGRFQHLLIDWHTLHARWLIDHNIAFLSETMLLVVKHSNARPVLNLYNISNVMNVTVEREYELPEVWNNCLIEIGMNSAPLKDLSPATRALFYPDPAARLLCIIAKVPVSPSGPLATRNWLFINETYFKPSRRSGLTHVPWVQWGPHCLIRDFSQNSASIKGPYIIGTRAVFLEPGFRGRSARLNVIDFVPYGDSSHRMSPPWSLRGQRTILAPLENTREVPESTTNGLGIDDIRITEDNIILFLDNGDGVRHAKILTFGAGPSPQ
ncbi:hypothetical protein AMATHDRAFT_141559 [Amanita thiersii Skay4041]|uniref:F-box domain-containing protein n=1 Tax=Amanita thiersii Skay4041 TaxID=703135 RepID=A0A2A9NU30_9AGAR|nr:hypothetical protein AMATHDRAFT_141559 [Amanita thiersii Skay4041]